MDSVRVYATQYIPVPNDEQTTETPLTLSFGQSWADVLTGCCKCAEKVLHE